MSNRNKIFIFFSLEILCIVVLSFLIFQRISAQEQVKVTFFDVGQGDAAIIDMGNNFQVLIDGGPDSVVLEKLGNVLPYYDRKIEIIILTHPDLDHISGLVDVLGKYEVGYVFATNISCESKICQRWKDLLKKKNIKVIDAFYGKKIIFDQDSYIDFLYPFDNLAGQKISKNNYASIVFKFIDGGNSFLFTGDMELLNEMEMYNAKTDISADVLKVAHHGSKTSSSILFIEKVNSKWAVISVGENRWGLPNEETINNLSAVGTKILITKELSDIEIISDGQELKIKDLK